MKLKIIAAAAVLSVAAATQAQAQSLKDLFVDDVFTDATDMVGDLMDTLMPGITNVRLGLGPVVSSEFEGSDEYDINLAPLISLRYKDLLQVDNNQIRVNLFGGSGALWQSSNFRAGPILKVDFGRSESDSPDLLGLGSVGKSVELGVFASYTSGPLRYRVRLRHDVVSGHEGAVADADVSLAIYRAESVNIGSRLSTTWVSKKYMNAFFGITPTQATASGLTIYTADSGLKDISLSVGGEFQVTPRWAVVVNAAAQRLIGDANNSPLVTVRGSGNQFSAGAYAVYSF
jgi:outer membrane scaffolding protein for murein synthesis (MipA/OmpV family)